MKVEIITIGDEILIGQIVDTNSAWMCKELTKNGFQVVAVTSVGDCKKSIIKSVDIAKTRADVILLTGGVGPTNDDITKSTLCEYFQTKMVFNNDVFENISQLFAKKNFAMNELTKAQAFVPENSTVINNKVGTAPILWFEHNGFILVSMPGVPFEMRDAMQYEIIPRLKNIFSVNDYLRKSFLVAGVTESALSISLQSFEESLPEGFSLAYLPTYGYVYLRLSALGIKHKDTLEQQGEKLKNALGELLIAETDKPLEFVLGELLTKNNYTVSTAESCSGGNIAKRIVSLAGASTYFKGSIVSYSNEIKNELLHVDKEILVAKGAVSEEVVIEMAINVSEIMKTDCAISVSGIAGPDGGTPEKPVGTVWICTKTPDSIVAKKYNFGTSRNENIQRTTNIALLQLIKMLNRQQAIPM